jgi:hypothetical protein
MWSAAKECGRCCLPRVLYGNQVPKKRKHGMWEMAQVKSLGIIRRGDRLTRKRRWSSNKSSPVDPQAQSTKWRLFCGCRGNSAAESRHSLICKGAAPSSLILHGV